MWSLARGTVKPVRCKGDAGASLSPARRDPARTGRVPRSETTAATRETESMARPDRASSRPGTPGRPGLTLAMCVAVLSACGHGAPGATALPPLPPGVRAFVAEVRYDVYGGTLDEIRTSLRSSASAELPGGATGYHRWDIKWTYRYARAEVYCELTDIAIELNSTITLPEWQRPPDADSTVVAAWDQYLEDLRGHELGHRIMAYRTAGEIRRALGRLRVDDCAFVVNEADRSRLAVGDRANRVTWPPRAR